MQQLPSNSAHRASLQGFSFNLSGGNSGGDFEDVYAIPAANSAEPAAHTALNHYVNVNEQTTGSQNSCSVVENIYDIPNVNLMDRTIDTYTSSTYTLPDDARRFMLYSTDTGSSESNTTGTTTTGTTCSSGTRSSWFGRHSPVLIIQQSHARAETQPVLNDDVSASNVARSPSLSSLGLVLGDHAGLLEGSSLPDLTDYSRVVIQQSSARFWAQSLARQSFKLPSNCLPSVADENENPISSSDHHAYTNLQCVLPQMDENAMHNLSRNKDCKLLVTDELESCATVIPLRSSSSSGCSDLSEDSRELAELHKSMPKENYSTSYPADKEASVGYNTASPSDEVYSPLSLQWYQSSEPVQTGYKSLNDLTKEPASMYTVPIRTPQQNC